MNIDNKYNKDKDKKDQTKTQGFIVVRPQGHLPCPTPLPEYHTREFSSLCQQTPFRQRKPYTPLLYKLATQSNMSSSNRS